MQDQKRSTGALESALARPAATFGGEDLYPDIADKAAALMHSLALDHPFVDGNKPIAAPCLARRVTDAKVEVAGSNPVSRSTFFLLAPAAWAARSRETT